MGQRLVNLALDIVGGIQLLYQWLIFQMAPVDGSCSTGFLYSIAIVLCAQQRAQVESGYTLKSQQQLMGANVGRDVFSFATEGGKQRDIQFIGGLFAVIAGAQTDESASVVSDVDQFLDLGFGNQSLQRTQANAIVTGNEIEVGAPLAAQAPKRLPNYAGGVRR